MWHFPSMLANGRHQIQRVDTDFKLGKLLSSNSFNAMF